MKVLQEYNKATLEIIKPNRGALSPYRMYTYYDECRVGNYWLLFNLATTEVLCLDYSDFMEDSVLPSFDISSLRPSALDYLLSHRFIVNKKNEDWRDVEEIRYLLKLRDQVCCNGFRNFTILPTTDCNARCYYCFEKGSPKITMDEKTALDTADFILMNCSRTGKKDVNLSWFGGEPLYNDRAIDIISKKLNDAGIVISSSMITNGLLLDAQKCEKAVELWKLKTIQITLDGTEKTYNKTKAYIDGVSNAFATVLTNIQNALDVGIEVSIRLNISTYNIEDIFLLADELAERFPNQKPSVYGAILIQYHSEERIAEKSELEKKLRKLKEKLRALGLMYGNLLSDGECPNKIESSARGGFRIYQCKADQPDCVVILPDGRLHSCEHIDDALAWGSIYSEGDKYTARYQFPSPHGEVSPYDYWSKSEICDKCRGCKVYPFCVKLLHCPGQSKNCDLEQKERILDKLEKAKQYYIREAEKL